MSRIILPLNNAWRFYRCTGSEENDGLFYDIRPKIDEPHMLREADARPTEAVSVGADSLAGAFPKGIKDWILPTANPFIARAEDRHKRPEGSPGSQHPFVRINFDDSPWQLLDLPHDWAIGEPFMQGQDSEVGGGMGRLPVNGVAWYRRHIQIEAENRGKNIFLEIDGAMSYAAVWVNGQLVGGWPYGYASWALDIGPYIDEQGQALIAIRLDNPNHSARWYPGAGLYRDVRLVITENIHFAQWGAFYKTLSASSEKAELQGSFTIDFHTDSSEPLKLIWELFDEVDCGKSAEPVSRSVLDLQAVAGEKLKLTAQMSVDKPRLWGPAPEQEPHRYCCRLRLVQENIELDRLQTLIGIRTIQFDANKGLLVNAQPIRLRGVNLHHDLGALGAAFNLVASERQLRRLADMGCNALRMAHNPPAPGLLDLADKLGFLVFNEIFDSWELKKTPHDFHLIFKDWSEADTRAFVRRDRNHPSVIIWGYGNEVGEQYTDMQGAAVAERLYDIIKEEDDSRPAALSMNYAKPGMALPELSDIISLNYQGEGIRQEPEFEGTDRIRTAPQYPAFKERYPQKAILSSETASAFSSRGIYLFPVSPLISAPVREGRGGDSVRHQVSAYELHAVDFGSTADKVFASLESHPFSAGEFVWTGWDHLGEPTPYYEARSSYCGIVDLAGFNKDRFYLYQSQWRPDFPMAHILPHWTWPERLGEITPVHVFTSGDEAELFLNGRSLGRKKKGALEYRLRWDEVVYEPGELRVQCWKAGRPWVQASVYSSTEPVAFELEGEGAEICADGRDLAFISISTVDAAGNFCPRECSEVSVLVEGAGELVALDNGDPTDLQAFSQPRRNLFSGRLLAIVRAKKGQGGSIRLSLASQKLPSKTIELVSRLEEPV